MSTFMDPNDRLLDLLSDKATQGLSASEQRELDRLLAETNMKDESERFEISATAIDIASNPSGVDMELPAELRDKVLMGAGEFFHDTAQGPSVAKDNDDTLFIPSSDRWRFRETLGWMVAAACLLLGLWLSNITPISDDPVAQKFSMADINAASDRVAADWVGVHAESVTGEVVWSDELQQGYMVFKGLPVNDPSIDQYQLWIFDKDVAQPVPTDGGVFDIVKEDGTSTVFFKPTYPVEKGVQFAVTIEDPGGVQQSDRSRLPVLATITDSNQSEDKDQ